MAWFSQQVGAEILELIPKMNFFVSIPVVCSWVYSWAVYYCPLVHKYTEIMKRPYQKLHLYVFPWFFVLTWRAASASRAKNTLLNENQFYTFLPWKIIRHTKLCTWNASLWDVRCECAWRLTSWSEICQPYGCTLRNRMYSIRLFCCCTWWSCCWQFSRQQKKFACRYAAQVRHFDYCWWMTPAEQTMGKLHSGKGQVSWSYHVDAESIGHQGWAALTWRIDVRDMVAHGVIAGGLIWYVDIPQCIMLTFKAHGWYGLNKLCVRLVPVRVW